MAEQLVSSGADLPESQTDPVPRATAGTPRPSSPGERRPGEDTDRRVQAAMAAWRARAAATADPRWARPGTAGTWPGWDAVYPAPQGPRRDAAGQRTGAGRRPEHGRGSHGSVPAVEPAGRVAGQPAGVPARRPGWLTRERLTLVAPAVLGTAGALITVISSTMTWATIRAFGLVEYSVGGLDGDQHGRLTLGLGVIAGLAAAGLAARPRGYAARLVAGLSGVAGLVTTLVALIDIGYLRGGGLLAGTGVEATTVIGPGLWLVLVGGLLAIAAALLARPGPVARRERGGDDRAGGEAAWW